MIRLPRVLPLALLAAVAVVATGGKAWVALAAGSAFLWLGRGRHRRRRRRLHQAVHRIEGQDEHWELRGVRVRLGPHELSVIGERASDRFPVHEVEGVFLLERDVVVRLLDGRAFCAGTSRADEGSLEAAVQTLDDAIHRRRRGGLEDKLAMEQALGRARARESSR